MKRIPLIAALAFIGLAASLNAAQAAPSAQDFVSKASEAGTFEIESSKLALEKSDNDDVKQFAQQMIDDHTKTADQLNSVLQSSGSQAQPTDTLTSAHAKIMKKLESKSGDDFDKKYIAVQTDAHKDAVKLFTSYSKHGDNAALKSFAAETLPTLQEHLSHVKELKSSM